VSVGLVPRLFPLVYSTDACRWGRRLGALVTLGRGPGPGLWCESCGGADELPLSNRKGVLNDIEVIAVQYLG